MAGGFACTALVAVALFAAGCGSSHKYPASSVDAFMNNCTAQAGATESGCRCVLDQLEKKMSFHEFARIDTKLVSGLDLSDSEQNTLADALAACR